MIDITVPEAIRFKSADFSVTKELRCPVCGGPVQYRSWDAEHEAFCYHCVYCGHDTKITWAAAAVLRAKGEVKFNANGTPIVPEDVEVPPIPSDPDNAAYEVWDIMKEIVAQEEQQQQQEEQQQTTKRTVTITGTNCTINNEAASSKAVEVNDGANYTFKVNATNEVNIIADSDVDFTKVEVTVDGTTLSAANKETLGVTWVVGTNDVTFTLSNVKANHTIVVSVANVSA